MIASCGVVASAPPPSGRIQISQGNLTPSAKPGLKKISNGYLYVPASYRTGDRIPLLVLLHKARGNASEWFRADSKGSHGLFAAYADQNNFAILAPNAGGETWGSGGPKSFGYSYIAINGALNSAFSHCAMDRNRLAIGGFSDGAAYALSLGLANGDVFSSIIAFSPGYIVGAPGRAKPSLFIAHGGGDQLLPIASTSRVFVAQLRKNGYQITFREFGGGHAVNPAVAEEAMKWLGQRFDKDRS